MKNTIAFILIVLSFGGCLSQDTTTAATEDTTVAEDSSIDSAACVFGCLESFERKGVQGDSKGLAGMDLDGSVCDKLDLDTLVGMCGSYKKSGTCISLCVDTPVKKIITSGLDYICLRRLDDFRKYMPCFKKTCPSLEQQCAPRCGMDLGKAQDQWFEQMGVNNTSGSNQPNPDISSDMTTTATPSNDGSGDDDAPGVLDTCQFVRCYMNCSRPVLESECSKDAYDLMEHTSSILLSFVMTPLEESWEAGTNSSLSDLTSTCDRYFSQALTDEGVDRSILKSASTRPTYIPIWSIFFASLALVLVVFRF